MRAGKLLMELLDVAGMAKCLILDKRYYEVDRIANLFCKRGLIFDGFIAGDGTFEDLEYQHIDTEEIPIRKAGMIDYATFYKSPAPLNALRCHKKMIQQALDENADSIILCEDDICFMPDFDEILKGIKDFEWDMLYLGSYNRNSKTKFVGLNLRRCLGGTGGFHAVAIKNKLFQTLLDLPELGPMDWMCHTFLHNQIEAYCIYPSIVMQKSGYSYIEGHNLDKPDRYDIL